MPTFVYKARSKSGERVEGTVDAADKRSALSSIENLGHVPVSVTEQSAGTSKEKKKKSAQLTWPGHKPRMKTRELLLFTTELSDLLASGMTLGNALNSLANRETGKAGDAIIAALRDEIVQGSSLSEALSKHPTTFSRLYSSMIKAGEVSGAVHEVLKRLVVHFERVQETKEKVVMALVYPIIVLVMGLATMFFTMTVVVPKFKEVFDQLGESLPASTALLMGISTFLVRYGLIVAAAMFGLSVLFKKAINTERGRLWWDGVMLKMPLIKGVVASGVYANFARTLSSLMANGVPVLQALSIVEQTVGNTVIEKELKNARERVTDGTTISRPLAAGKVFPVMMIDMLSIGEQTGDMPGALMHIANRYESELDRNLKIFTTALEPILIVLIAAGVGFVAISILMAVFSLSGGLSI